MIRNIIFDYGGVIIDLDYEKPREEFEKLGVKDFEQHFTQLNQTPLFDDFDKGNITEKEFREKLREEVKVDISDQEFDRAWNSILGGVREEKLQLLHELYADNYKCYLLSNTNFIHLKCITKILLKTHGRFNLDALFNKVYYSCVVRMRKPEPAIYKKVIGDNDLKPQETIFIDDSPQHIEGAKALNLQTILYDPKTDLKETLMPYLKENPSFPEMKTAVAGKA